MNKQKHALFKNFLETNLKNSAKLQEEASKKAQFELMREYQYKANCYYTILQTYNKLNQKA